jgi:hypothetical protein
MKLKKFRIDRSDRGQSFVELALVLTVILLLLAGVVEFGNLLNQYINLVDGAREGARFGSNADPFIRSTTPFGIDANFFTGIDRIVEGEFVSGVQVTKGAIAPISLNAAAGDDVVISFFSKSGGSLARFPDADGWNRYHNKASALSNATITGLMDASAPDTGILLVEIFYNYSQILKMPFFTAFVPDPIRVHTYSIMPLSAAEPTPTPY